MQAKAPAKPSFSWRLLEQEIISILRDEGAEFLDEAGDTFVKVCTCNEASRGLIFSVTVFAQTLADRLRSVKP